MQYLVLLIVFGMGYMATTKKRVSPMSMWILVAIMILFVGTTYVDAPDVPGYMHFFNNDVSGDLVYHRSYQHHHFEIGYIYINKIFKMVSSQYWVYQLLLTTFEYILVVSGLRKLWNEKQTVIYMAALFLVLPSDLLGAMRQGVAISVFVFSWQFIKSRSLIKYCLCIWFGSLFHTSVLILLPFYYGHLLYEKLGFKFLFLLLLICDFCYVSHITIGDYMEQWMSSLSDADEAGVDRYAVYSEDATNDVNFGWLKFLEMNVIYIASISLFKPTFANKFLLSLLTFFVVNNTIFGGIIAHRFTYFVQIPYYMCFIQSMLCFARRFSSPYREPVAYVIYMSYMIYVYVFKLSGAFSINGLGFRNLMMESITF